MENFLENVQSVDDLVEVMTVKNFKGRKNLFFYHYTSLENYLKMRKSGKIELTRGDSTRLNDHLEKFKGGLEGWKNLYIACFTKQAEESVAMWETYSYPLATAIRLQVSRENILGLCENRNQKIYKVNLDSSNRYEEVVENDLTFSSLAFTGVSYWNYESGCLSFKGKSIKTKDKPFLEGIYANDKMRGRLKNYAWEYEIEFRILAQVRAQNGIQLPEKIAIDAPDLWVGNNILCSPCLDKDDAMQTLHFTETEGIGRVENSQLLGFLNLSKECICCKNLNAKCSRIH